MLKTYVKYSLTILILIIGLVFLYQPQVFAQVPTCGNVYPAGFDCPAQCPAVLFTPNGQSQQAICCGTVGANGVCTLSQQQYACGTSVSASQAATGQCTCASGFNQTGPDSVCCGYTMGGTECRARPVTTYTCGETVPSDQTPDASCACGSGFTAMGSVSCCGWATLNAQGQSVCSPTEQPSGALCGQTVNETATCPAFCPIQSRRASDGRFVYCCGSWDGETCRSTAPGQTNPPNPAGADFLAQIDPLMSTGRFFDFQTPGAFLNQLIPYLFTFAGLILFIMLLWGGFEMLSGAATPKSQEAGKQRITAALTGFALLFMSYWFAQIIEYIFGLNIL